VIKAYPFIIHTSLFDITGFGILMMLAFLMAGWILDRELRRLHFNTEYAGDLIFGAVFGGIVGAKLWFVVLNGGSLFDRSGLVWYGGFFGGTLGVMINGWRRHVPVRWTAHLAGVVLPAAYAIGRIGCFVVGDDYGGPTTLPWGVAFPKGSPPSTAENLRLFHVQIPEAVRPETLMAVHPTQLYESLIMLGIFALLWRWRSKARGTGWLFGAYLVFAGIERFFIEILRAKDDRLFGAFTVAQVTSIGIVIVGAALIVLWSRTPAVEPGTWLSTPHGGVDRSPKAP
jgi:phosphatidylglycerol---prolipoprotein diacylglyceryl transferase